MKPIDRSSHNWLIHQINNDVLTRYLHRIRGNIVDLGCGTCPYREAIVPRAREYIGVDWKSSAHDTSRVDVFANLIEPLPFADGYADTVVAFQVMEHLPEPDLFLAECNRILKKGGGLLLTVPFMWHVHEAPDDYFRYTRHGLEYLLQKNGFTNIEIEENTGFWQMLVLKFNYHTARFARGAWKLLFIPLWWIGQSTAPLLDRGVWDPGETASYTAWARKR